MANMLSLLQLFIQSVAGHLITILAGTAATVILDQLRRLAKRHSWIKDDWPDKWQRYIILAFFCFASFQAWEDQYLRNIATQGDLRRQGDTTRSISKNYELCESELSATRGVVAGHNGQINSQQETLNTCVVALAKNNAPQPLIIKTFMVGTGITSAQLGKPKNTAVVILGTTNQTLTPIRATLECEYPFDSIAPPGLAGKTGDISWQTSISRSRPSDRQLDAYIDSPAWNPGDLLAFPIASVEPGPGKCQITQAH